MIQIDNPQVEQYIYPPRQLATTSSAFTFTIHSDLTLKKYAYEVEDEGRGQYFKFKIDFSNAKQGEYIYTIKEYFNTVGQGLIRIGKVSDAIPDYVAYNPDDVEVEQYYYDANYEDRSVEYTSNGDYEVLPSAGYDALSRVRVTVNVDRIDPAEVIASAVTEANAYTDSALTDYLTSAETQEAISSALSDYTTSEELTDVIESALTDYYTSAQTDERISSALTDYYTSGQTDEKIAEAVSGIDLSDYYTSAQTDERISSALTDYYTSGQTEEAISEALENIITSTTVKSIWCGSTAQYNTISPKDPNTLYFIND